MIIFKKNYCFIISDVYHILHNGDGMNAKCANYMIIFVFSKELVKLTNRGSAPQGSGRRALSAVHDLQLEIGGIGFLWILLSKKARMFFPGFDHLDEIGI